MATADLRVRRRQSGPAARLESRWARAGWVRACGERLAALPVPAAAVVVYLVLVATLLAVMTGLSVVLVDGDGGSRLGTDPAVASWLAGHRTEALDAWTALGSRLADTVTITLATVLCVALLAWRRHRIAATVVAAAVLIKVSAFLATTVVVSRHRPDVPHLDAAPPTSSFPSGHVAASVAFWVSLALVTLWVTRSTWLRALAWAGAVLVPVVVAVSRLYRGMHFPSDVACGYLLGLLAVLAAVLAVAVLSEARRHRLQRGRLERGRLERARLERARLERARVERVRPGRERAERQRPGRTRPPGRGGPS